MLKNHLTKLLVVVAVGALGMLALPAPQAWAGEGCGADLSSCPGGSDTPVVDGRTITVTVTSTFAKAGSSGSGGTSTASVKINPPCYYTQGFTGKELFEWVDSGQAASEWRHTGGEGPYEPSRGYKKHRDDNDGHWYGATCTSAGFDNLDEFFDFADEWFAEHETVFVELNDSPPIPPIPAELLLQAAREGMELPKPVFDWNPRSGGHQATLVNLDTWLWLEDQTGSGTVTASAGSSSVTVDAKLDKVTFSAPTANAVTCNDAGTPWTPAATDDDCTLRFARSQASTPVTAASTWALSWSANGKPRGTLDPVTAEQTSPVDVIEVQTVVTEVN